MRSSEQIVKERTRFEVGELTPTEPEHWDTWDATIYIWRTKGSNAAMVRFYVPMDIVRHLGLKSKDLVTAAIRHVEVKE